MTACCLEPNWTFVPLKPESSSPSSDQPWDEALTLLSHRRCGQKSPGWPLVESSAKTDGLPILLSGTEAKLLPTAVTPNPTTLPAPTAWPASAPLARPPSLTSALPQIQCQAEYGWSSVAYVRPKSPMPGDFCGLALF